MDRQTAVETLARYYKQATPVPPKPPTFKDWSEHNFWIADEAYAIPRLIKLIPHQPIIVDYALDPNNEFQTIVYSTIKKSGKTTIGAAMGRYIAETFGPYSEVYCLANDLEQARGRVYQQLTRSIELDPRYNVKLREIPNLWRVIQKEATHFPTKSIARAVSSDYKGEAGSNPTATIWSELWGYTTEDSKKLWYELTPVPTRRSLRIVETYAGFEDEPGPLWDLWQLAKEGRQLTVDDIDWPYPGPVPIWVNDRAKLFAYIDQGPLARRMPWQTKEYYETQAATLPTQAYQRLHYNYWTTSITAFIPIEWWLACYDETMKPLNVGDKKPCVLGVDAAVSGDCCAAVLVSRHGDSDREIDVHFSQIWEPPKGGKFDYDAPGGLYETILDWCAKYNVVQVAYDAYQLHYMMTRIQNDGIAWCRPFSQAGERSRGDKQLYDMIRDRHLHHRGNDTFMEQHLRNAAAKQARDEDTRLRLVKKSEELKIDDAVALSMCVQECLRLTI